MRHKLLLAMAIVLASITVMAQEPETGFNFKMKNEVKTTSVKDQASSGTCWAFATTSFIETELLRQNKGEFDISEMFFVRSAYESKGMKYVRFQGANNFGQGGQAHDVFDALRAQGMVTETEYPGLNYGTDAHAHSEMEKILQAMLDVVIKNPNRKLSTAWFAAYNGVLDAYLGAKPDARQSPLAKVALNADDYVEITSFSNYPFYQQVMLEIPDNWAHRLYYNVPLDDLMQITKEAITNGYSVCWDGDVSEKSFAWRKGVAVLPQSKLEGMSGSDKERWTGLSEKERKEKLFSFDEPVPEIVVNQENRQANFDNYTTTDDHLMHLTGIATDQNGTEYYLTKNSWSSESGMYKGYLYMSDSFVRMKTVAILVHKSAIPKQIAKKMGLK